MILILGMKSLRYKSFLIYGVSQMVRGDARFEG